MSEESFTSEDRASLVRWIKSRGGSEEQAVYAARQLMKRAVMNAESQGIAPIEAMGQLLEKVTRAEEVFQESTVAGSVESESGSAESPQKGA